MYDQSFPQQPHNQQHQPHNQGPHHQQPQQHPYQQQPYQQQAYQQGYQQAPPPQQQYGQPYQPQHPYHQQPPVPHQAAAAPRIPEPANDMRRIGAVTLDALLTLTAALVGFRVASGDDLPFGKMLLIIAGSGFGVSFLNQVILPRISGASIGKFATRTRVIYEKSGARPQLPRLFRRWLGGYLFIAIWLIAALLDSADDGPDDFCGIRLVRYRDLRAASPIPGR